MAKNIYINTLHVAILTASLSACFNIKPLLIKSTAPQARSISINTNGQQQTLSPINQVQTAISNQSLDGKTQSYNNAGRNSILVLRDDTLYKIAKRHQLPLRLLIEENFLLPPYRLQEGQILLVPTIREHRVRAGETVYGISRKYNINMHALMSLNNIQKPYPIKVNQRLILPPSNANIIVSNREAIQVQQTALVRVTDSTGDLNIPRAPKPSSTTNTTSNDSSLLKIKQTLNQITSKTNPSSSAKIKSQQKITSNQQPPPRSKGKFLWPVRGKIISNFGPKGKGLHNDGVNIAAPVGVPVKAADNGIVAYVGQELSGYGKLILIKHSDGFITAYGHNDHLLVKRGDVIKRGETIARVGTSGNVDRPQLHFELRKGPKALNPIKFLES